MPLSEGATRARHARRLLQRVLDYAPDGTTIHPIVRIGRHAAEGIIEASAEQEADLIIFGWGGKAPAGRDGARADASSRRRSTRSSASRRATSPSSSSAARSDIRRVLVPVRGGPHAELALRFADAIARHHEADGRRPPPRPAGDHAGRPGPGRTRARRVRHGSTSRGKGEARPARGAERPQRDPARGREGRPRRHGRLGRAGRADGETYLFGALPEAIAARAQADGRRRQDPRDDRPPDVRAARVEGRDARRRRPRRRGSARRPGPRRALVRRVELPPRRVRRPAPARPAQGEAGR